MLSERANETLPPLVMTLRIIVIALSLGVTILGIIAAAQNASKPQTFGTKVNYLFLAIATPMFIAGFVVPRLLPKSRAQPQVAGKSEPDDAAAVQAAFGPIQTATIVGCALFEAAALANLTAYITDAELVHLAVSGIALLCILAHFPITSRIEQQIEDQIQARRDEQQFKTWQQRPMAVDTPAKIAILGAGPIGLEAALYARVLGYDVAIYETGPRVAEAVCEWGHARMFTPFGMNRSPLGLTALKAQDEGYSPPADDELLTGREWVERYLAPLSQTDLLADHLRLNTRVIRVGKGEIHKDEMAGHEDRGDWPFRLLARGPDGVERLDEADVVIDATGVFAARPKWCGYGGIPAAGEMDLRESGAIEYRLPEILARDRSRYLGKHTLLIGAGYSAATNAVALAQLIRDDPKTRVTWITRREGPAAAGGPLTLISSDRLPERQRLAREANALTGESNSGIAYWPGSVVEAIEKTGGGEDHSFAVMLAGPQEGRHTFDRIIANIGFTPDRTLYEELQVHECYASLGPMKLAAALLGSESADCLAQKACGAKTLLNPEPNFYILGAKSYGRKSNFLLSVGLQQIREVFTIIGDRETLDLYGRG